MTDALQQKLLAAAGELALPACTGYLQRPLPTALDAAISDILDAYSRAAPLDREVIAGAFEQQHASGLLVYAERMSTLAIREGSKERALSAFLAILLEGFRWEPRESLAVLSVVADSCRRVGVAPSELVEAANRLGPQPTTSRVSGFLGRTPEDQSIESMGYALVSTPDGLSYARRW